MSNIDFAVSVLNVSLEGRSLSLADEERLVSVLVQRAASTCDRFEMRFDLTRNDAPIAHVGDVAEIALGGPRGSHVVLLNAEVTSKSIEVGYNGTTLVIAGYDRRHTLTRSIHTRAFNDATFADVVQKIAANHSLSLTDKTEGALSSTIYPHIMQAGSDFELVQQIAYRVGAEWYVENNELTLQIRPTSGPVVELSPLENLTAFNVRFSPIEHPTGVSVQGWDASKTETIIGSAGQPKPVHDFHVEKAERNHLTSDTAVSWSVPVISIGDANDIAAAIGRRLASASVVGHGETTGTPELVPGGLCKVSGVGDDFSGTYHVASVEHSFGANGSYRTRFRIGSLEPSSLIDLFSDREPSHGQILNGVTIGIVSNIEHPDGQPGVAKLKLPYLGDTVESGWARLLSFGGGEQRGAVFVPEVGDEVLVAFEHGDIAKPYVLGTVWNATHTRASFEGVVKEGKVEERRIVSKLGSRLRFIDIKQGDDESGLSLEVDDAKTKLFFGYNKTEIVTEGRPLELKNGMASILLDNDEITITARSITLTASGGDIQIDGNNVNVTAKAKLAVTGSQAELKATAQATLQASGIMTIKGAMVKVN